MAPKKPTRSLVEAAFLSALTVVFCLATLYLPMLGLITSVLWPIPIVLLGVRHDLRLSILATFVAGIIVAILAGPLVAIHMFLGLGVLGLVLGTAMRHRLTPLKVVGLGTIALLVSFLLLFSLSLFVMGINPWESYFSIYQDSLESTISLYERLGINPDTIAQMEATLGQSLSMIRYLMPMALVAGSVVLAVVNFLLSRSILARLGVAYPGFPPFASWRLPRTAALGYLAGIALIVISDQTAYEVLRHIGINIQAIFQLALLIHGLAVAWHFMEEYRLSKGLKILAVAFAFITPVLGQILFFVGLLDLFFDFRRLGS